MTQISNRACLSWIAASCAAVLIVVPSTARAATGPSVQAAQEMFYNGRYPEAAAVTADGCTTDASTLSACELRTSALLFQIRRAMGDGRDQDKAFKQCQSCAGLLATFVADVRAGQLIAREQLKTQPSDLETLFFLSKIDLNYVWLQLGILGHKTGWGEYWEARRSLDELLKQRPDNIRAKVSRAWIDYIVDTRLPRGTRWLLGGGDKKRGLSHVREAAVADADRFVLAEAGFALWDMQVREKKLADAVVTAARLSRDFPGNAELRRFLDVNRGLVAR